MIRDGSVLEFFTGGLSNFLLIFTYGFCSSFRSGLEYNTAVIRPALTGWRRAKTVSTNGLRKPYGQSLGIAIEIAAS